MRMEKRDAILSRLQQALQHFSTNLPSFGPELGTAPPQDVVDSIICHRFLSKFEFPKAGNDKARRDSSILAMIEQDVPHTYAKSDYTDWAKLRLSHWFRGFRPTYRFVVPSGASAKANGLDHDIMVKLQNLDNWEISPELVSYAFNIVWHNHALKRLVRARFRERYDILVMNPLFRAKHGHNGYHIFREQFKALLSYNAVSRVETVPKNNEVDRVITCEPLWNMICQLSYMTDIRTHARKTMGYDVNSRGDLHRTLLDGDIATIDLKRASDLLTKQLVLDLWPEHMSKQLIRLRPKIVEYQVGDSKESHFHSLEMFAPMGTGITFDVMTFTLLALLRFDKSASVFGDDIIVKTENAQRAVQVLTSVGLVVNESKSFTSGSFKESCGGMYHKHIGDIESYDFKYPKNVCDVIVIVNKLNCLLKRGQASFELQGHLLECRDGLVGTLPRVVFAEQGDPGVSSEYVWGMSSRPPGRRTDLETNLSVFYQRDVQLFSSTVQIAKQSDVVLDDISEWMNVLFRGGVKPAKKETFIVNKLSCTWTCSPLLGEVILPGSI